MIKEQVFLLALFRCFGTEKIITYLRKAEIYFAFRVDLYFGKC